MGGYLKDIAKALRSTSEGSGTPLIQSSNGGAQANNVTLAGAAGKTTYITGFEITGAGATAASVIAVTLTGTGSTNTPTWYIPVPAGANVGITPLVAEFPEPIPASAQNTGLTLNVPSFGTGNTSAAAVAHGYQQ